MSTLYETRIKNNLVTGKQQELYKMRVSNFAPKAILRGAKILPGPIEDVLTIMLSGTIAFLMSKNTAGTKCLLQH